MKKVVLNYEIIVFTAVCLASLSSELQAGASSVTGKNAAGATVIFDTTTDGGGSNLVPWQIICDATTPSSTNCVAVNSSGQISIQLPPGGATSSNQALISSTLTTMSALSSSLNIISSTIATNTAAAIPAGSAGIGNVGATIYPIGAVAITAAATGSTAATTATLASSSSLHTYICGFSVRANATAAASSNMTVTGVVTGTMSFLQWTSPNTGGVGVTEEIFNPCIVSSASNQAIAVVSAAPGTGGLVSVAAWGYTGPN